MISVPYELHPIMPSIWIFGNLRFFSPVFGQLCTCSSLKYKNFVLIQGSHDVMTVVAVRSA